ncbi:MAG TPA: xanthine dehydrogenase family protein molybdopterin-binding subunit, partial [Tepidisphaeraceae bacterium]|nr:xanthine dehydrogenase family protein molybdopterin-binding subunit [Tepidisphaeraceae bacterium]
APVQNCAYAYILQSTISNGAMKSIDTSAAEKAPCVIVILTPANIAELTKLKKPGGGPGGGGMLGEQRMPLSDMTIHYGGQHVAVVVAETSEQARYAADLIKIDYDTQPPIVSIDDPNAKGSKPSQNMGEPLQAHRGEKVDAVLSRLSDLTVVRATYDMPTETHNPMEPSAATAVWDGDRLTIYDATQFVMGVRGSLAGAFGIPPENVRAICPFTGGGFGCKGAQWPHEFLAAAAAKATNRPVKLVLSRKQMFSSCGHRPTLRQEMTLAASKDGKLQALRHDTTMHGSQVSDYIEPAGATVSVKLYACENLEISHTVKKMNVAPPTFMRAPGECPGTYALESAMDELSYALGIDPLQLRRINHADVHPESKKPWSSKHLLECYDLASEKFGWKNRNPQPRSMRADDGRLIGWGMATATYPGYSFGAAARIKLISENGEVRCVASCACHDLGTGAYTAFTQITADTVGLPADKVKFQLGDTTLPFGPVAGGSNTTASVSQAIVDAGDALKEAIVKLVKDSDAISGLYSTDLVLRDGKLVSKDDPSKAVSLVELIQRGGRGSIEVQSAPPGNLMPGGKPGPKTDKGGEDYGANRRKYEFQSFGCHFVEVHVDEPIARVRVMRVVSAMDIGRVINPKTSRSQVMGGVIMGIGMALMEGTEYDPASGCPINASLADYAVCVNADIHAIEPYFVDHPDVHMNAMGCRGVGEIGITGAAAAVANAIYHATGKRVRDLPITPDKLL